MATFTALNGKPYLQESKSWYMVQGEITEEDIKKINSIPENIVLVLKNTKGQNADVIKNITNSNIEFSIVGGLDYFNKNKFRSKNYIARTLIKPKDLSAVIKYFEKIESKIRYNWTNTQKCMYIYKTLTEALHYNMDHEPEYVNGKDVVRSLNGLLHGRLVCSGFALVFKEAMDRIGIPCAYQNRQGHHSWNIVELEGKLRGVELTWDCCGKNKNNNKCGFMYFGRQNNKDFYYGNDGHHDISYETEEKMYNFEAFDSKQLESDLGVITNNGQIKKYESKEIIDKDGNKLHYILGEEKDGVKEYFVSFDNNIRVIYSKESPEKVISKRNIVKSIISGNPCIGNTTIPTGMKKTKLFTRTDGTTFCIKETKKSKDGVNEFYIIDLAKGQSTPTFRRGTIISELYLTYDYGTDIDKKIANSLLSSDRVARKINFYQGYVGYLGKNGGMYYDEKFEKEKLNIHTRRF